MARLRRLLHLHVHEYTTNQHCTRRECCTCGCAQRIVNGTWKETH